MAFHLKNLALYAKYHYQRSKDIWADVTKCIEADGYTPSNHTDVLNIVVNNVAKLYPQDIGFYTRELLEAIDPDRCWVNGYYHKGQVFFNNNPEFINRYDDVTFDVKTALIYFYLKAMAFAKVEDLDGLPEASPNVLPLKIKET